MNSWFCDRLFPTQNGVNPFDTQPQFTKTPLLPNPHPNPASTNTSVRSPVPVRPTDRQFVPKAVYEAVLHSNRMYISQIKHLQDNIKDFKGLNTELRTKLFRSNQKIKSVELQRNNATAEANRWKEETSNKEIRCEKLVHRNKELCDKMKKLKEEETIFKAQLKAELKTELKAEADKSKKLPPKVRTLQKTLLQLKKTLKCHTSAHKKEMESQQQEFNRKLGIQQQKFNVKLMDCSVAVNNEIRQNKSLLRKINKLKKENLGLQEQWNKTKQENWNLMSKLETQKEMSPCKCECAKEAEDLWKLVRQLQESTKGSQVQPTQKRK
ncbi:unnamed protein product [Orchesella dallaii]|uniref:Uncharacterized protein n=1 Tax=Orchesella dallaii TaxID=48710 RepID=A0ABP1RRQ1_9HEXA